MNYYHGGGRRGPYFEGWYLKHQGEEGELALIPAIHRGRRGEGSASVQVVTRDGSRMFHFSERDFDARTDRFQVRVGNCWFSPDGVHLDLEEDGFSLKGELRYGPLTPPESDIMGPFHYVPGMQCVHSVLSMDHSVEGLLTLNGRSVLYQNGRGYIEGDRGRSFPRAYLWTQCLWQERQRGSLMLSVAHIPMPVGGFLGCIGEVHFGGKSWRLATYQGVRVEAWSSGGAVVRQGDKRLAVELLRSGGQPLRAPQSGAMARTIRESLCAAVRYRFWVGGELIFDHTDQRASFEYADQEGEG